MLRLVLNLNGQSRLVRADANQDIAIFCDLDFLGSFQSVIQHIAEHDAKVVTIDVQILRVETQLCVDSNPIRLADIQCVCDKGIDYKMARIHSMISVFDFI